MTLYLGTKTTAARCGYKSNGATPLKDASPCAAPRCTQLDPMPHVHFERDALICSFVVAVFIAALHYGVML